MKMVNLTSRFLTSSGFAILAIIMSRTWYEDSNKQLLDEVFVISGIIKVEVTVISQGHLDYSGYHKNLIQ